MVPMNIDLCQLILSYWLMILNLPCPTSDSRQAAGRFLVLDCGFNCYNFLVIKCLMSEKLSSIEVKRHSLAHILAQAVQDMFPEANLGIGPYIENGFYYDFDLPRTLAPEDLPILEKKMKHIIKQNQEFTSDTESIDDAIAFLKKTKQSYKIELVEGFKAEGHFSTRLICP